MRVEHGLVLAIGVLVSCLSLSAPTSASTTLAGEGKSLSPPSATWHRVADIPCQPRLGAGVTVFQNKLWIMGGEDDDFDSLNDIWNSSDGIHWTQVVPQAPWSAGYAPAVVFKDQLWLFQCSAGIDTWDAIWLSSDGISWSQVASKAPWQGNSWRNAYAVSVFQNKLWVMGGSGDYLYQNDVWSSSDGINWTCAVLHAPWLPRYGLASAVYDNKLWVMGGTGSSGEFGDVWYTENGTTWINASQRAWHERIGHFAAGYDGALWVFGGGYVSGSGVSSHSVSLDEVQSSTDGTDWVRSPLPPGSGIIPCGVLDGKLWFVGFAYDSTHIECLSPVTVSITRDRAPLSLAGQALTLKLATTGFPGNTTTCQWLKDGTAIPYATTDTYHVDHIALADAGSYTCQVTDENGVVFSADPAPVAVSAEKVPAAGPAGLALGVCLAASVLVLRQRKSPLRS